MSEVICNAMVCLDAVCLRLLPLHLYYYFFLLVLICFFCGRTALSISPFSLFLPWCYCVEPQLIPEALVQDCSISAT